MRPKVATLSMNVDDALREAEDFGLKECPYVAAIRFDGPLFFANASFLEDEVYKIRSIKPELRHILIAADGINDMDASGEEALSLLIDSLRSGGLGVSMSGVKQNIQDVLKRTHMVEKIGETNIYATKKDAIKAIYPKTHNIPGPGEIICTDITCPLVNYIPLDTDLTKNN